MVTLLLHLRSDVARRGFEPRTSGVKRENSTNAPRGGSIGKGGFQGFPIVQLAHYTLNLDTT